MSREKQGPSLREIQVQKYKLESIIGSKSDDLTALEKKLGQPGLENLTEDIKIAQEIPLAETAIENAENEWEQVSKQFNADALTSEAQDFLAKIGKSNSDIETLRTALPEGSTRDNLLRRREEELADFTLKGHEDERIKMGMELVKEQEEYDRLSEAKADSKTEIIPVQSKKTEKIDKKTPEIPQTGKIEADLSKRILIVDGRSIRFYQTNLSWELFKYILKKSNKRATTKELLRVAKRVELERKNVVGNAMFGIRNRIEIDSKNPKILMSFGIGKNTGYLLNADISFVGEPEKPKEKVRKPLPDLIDSRIEAINVILNDSTAGVEEVIKILGPSEKTNKLLTRPQAMWAIGRSVNLLYARIKSGQANESDFNLWKHIKEATGKRKHTTVRETFITNVDALFKKDKKPLTDEEIEQEQYYEEHDVQALSDVEAAILAAAINSNRDLLAKADLPTLDPEVAEKLWNQVKGKIKIDREDLQFKRKNIFDKAAHLIESDALYELIDLESSEALALFDYLTSADSQRLLEFLRTWLSGGNLDLLIEKFNLEKNDNGQKQPPIKKSTIIIQNGKNPAMQEVPKAKAKTLLVSKAPETEKISKTQLPKSPKKPKHVKEKPGKKIIEKVKNGLSIERHDPEVRAKINQILNEIVDKGITKPISGALTVKYFPALKASYVDNAVENGYVSPKSASSKGYQLDRAEIVTLLYRYRFGNNLTKQDRRSLEKIITEEIEKREKK